MRRTLQVSLPASLLTLILGVYLVACGEGELLARAADGSRSPDRDHRDGAKLPPPGGDAEAGAARDSGTAELPGADLKTPPASFGFYGTPWHADSLGNIPLDGEGYGYGSPVDYRFRASYTGTVTGVRVYLMHSQAGYAAGTGGSVAVELHADDGSSGHRPASAVLTTGLLSNPTASYFPLITFKAPAQVTGGALYHLVWSNKDPSPNQNWVSLNCLYQEKGSSYPLQPFTSDLDLAVLDASGKLNPDYPTTPIYSLSYSDGRSQGVGYMEVWANPEGQATIGGGAKVREELTVSGPDRTIDQVTINLKRTSGSGALTVRLEQASGALVEEGTIASSAVATDYGWVTYPLSAPRVLKSGQGYHLVLSAPAGTTYRVYPLRDGSDGYEFAEGSVFADGRAQISSGSSWTGWTYWGETNRSEADLQLYFRVVP